jgi:hypothetical protein
MVKTQIQQLEDGRLISVYEGDYEMLTAINRIFLKDKGFDLDPTYSKGVFYRKFGFQEPREKSDLVSLYPEVKQMDCRKLDFPREWFNSIIFDPPFLFRDRKAINNDVICGRFSFFKTFEELIKMYEDSLKEFNRVLKVRGFLVFKCQDMTDGSGSIPFFDTHCEVIKMARNNGFSLRDIGILVKKNKIIRKSKVQGCLRKVHCYYLIFRKETNLTKLNNGNDGIPSNPKEQ